METKRENINASDFGAENSAIAARVNGVAYFAHAAKHGREIWSVTDFTQRQI